MSFFLSITSLQDRPGLKNPKAVEALQDTLLTAFQHFINETRPQTPVHWAKILMKVTFAFFRPSLIPPKENEHSVGWYTSLTCKNNGTVPLSSRTSQTVYIICAGVELFRLKKLKS